jgi:hypothetical protein
MPANHRSAVDTCEYAQSSGQGQPNKCDHDALPRSMSFDDRKSALLGFGPRCAGAHGQPSGTVFGSGMRSVTAGGTLRDRAWMPIDRASSARCRPGRQVDDLPIGDGSTERAKGNPYPYCWRDLRLTLWVRAACTQP